MFLNELTLPVTKLKGVGATAAEILGRLGINNLGDLLKHYPRGWEDRSRHVPLKDWESGPVCTEVKVLAADWIGFGRKKTLKIYIEDSSARACLVCFNRPFLGRLLKPGMHFRLYGNFSYRYGEIQSTAFDVAPVGGINEVIDPILPIYPLSLGMTQNMLRRLMRNAVEQFAPGLENEIPEPLIEKNDFFNKGDAIKSIHFPASMEDLEKARKTLIYEELFSLELMVLTRAMERKKISMEKTLQKDDFGNKDSIVPPGSEGFSPLQKRLLERLPFSLTPGQVSSVCEINADMRSPFPMARLLEGDVGSGKTLVSFLAMLGAIEKGGQAALMAPTELLARQHAESAAKYLEPLGIRIAFLTGNINSRGRKELLNALKDGEVDLAAGTHALFSKDVEYKNLSLVVVDEQHRFGVLQRQAIMDKGLSPDLLMMSATPIPRSLALTVFGDLDVSVIRDLPPGRKPVKTHLARESNEGKVYEFVRNELSKGRQAYFVYPLIEGGEDNELKDAVSMAGRLANEVFPQFPLKLLHSKVDDDEKRQTMDDFRQGNIKILAATSVVEVGVDVPNATCMVVEHAERFGLSALHQLRGRVGRGEEQAYCFLVYSDRIGDDGKARLKVMLENSDGFIIAEEDLKLRGPGQITGVEQSGYLSLGIADPVRDIEVLGRARSDAIALLEADPSMENHDYPKNISIDRNIGV